MGKKIIFVIEVDNEGTERIVRDLIVKIVERLEIKKAENLLRRKVEARRIERTKSPVTGKDLDEILEEALVNAPSIQGYTIEQLTEVINRPWPTTRRYSPYDRGMRY
jgi:hypothetical protein